MTVTIVNWNLQWATSRSRRTPEIKDHIAAHAPAVACLTEASVDLFSGHGHVICSRPEYGYSVDRPARRKVICGRGSRGVRLTIWGLIP